MGIASLASDSVPNITFTPQEPLVELLKVSLAKDAVLVMASAQDKAFLFTWLVKEWAWSIRRREASVVILVQLEKQAILWRDLFVRSTDLKPHSLEDGGSEIDSNGLFVETAESMDSFLTTNVLASSWLKISLMIIDNGQCLLSSPNGRRTLDSYAKLRHSSSRLLVVTSGILDNSGDRLRHLDDQLHHLETFYPCQPEASCELMSLLRFIANPRMSIVQYLSPKSASAIELEIEAIVARCLDFLRSHTYSLFDTYGEEYLDLIEDIPDPVELPLKILEDFLYVTRTLGVWCAERASLVLLIKIDKLKTREKYERHFLLLSMIYTEMVRIRRLCSMVFENLTEKEKIENFSKPKVLKLVQILRQYKPEHIQTPGHHKKNKPAPAPVACPGEPQLTPHVRRSRGHYSSYDDPNALCGVVFVQSKFASKLLYHFLKDLSRSEDTFSFLMPQYATMIGDINDVDDEDMLDVEAEKRKQEEALRRFRMKECNILISNSLIEVGIDSVRCNLVVAFDPPKDFHSYAQYKVKAKSQKASFFLIFSEEETTAELVNQLALYQVTEERLKTRCTVKGPVLDEVTLADKQDSIIPPFSPRVPKLSLDGVPIGDTRPASTLKSAIFYLNRYCAKLPSDTFTRLTPLYDVVETLNGNFKCTIQLPINSPFKEVIVGPVMPSLELAKRAAALEACKKLHQIKELDDYMLPIGKDGPKKEWEPKSNIIPIATEKDETSDKMTNENIQQQPLPVISSLVEELEELQIDDVTISTTTTDESKTISEVKNTQKIGLNKSDESLSKKVSNNKTPNITDFRDSRPGTTKRRQYYYKQVAKCLTVDEGSSYYLYLLRLKLSCAIPDDQNTRGRSIFDPITSSQCFGMLTREPLPAICEFPIYTRSGEVFVDTVLLNDKIYLTSEQTGRVFNFHRYTFSTVLRLEKYPMTFSPHEADNKVIILPLNAGLDIDWTFLETIERFKDDKLEPVSNEARDGFVFDENKYKDAVVMPWYRNQDQPQYFYVAEICSHLSPKSAFPGQGFETFEKYYESKYKIIINNLDQPLLDVDHTSARLNFLTPRYINRKGVALPTSSEETKRNKRENLEQKQILVPELCSIHPFPASLWKHAVCLPCIMYRLNALLIADELRATVSCEMAFGISKLEPDYKWPALTFGWTLSEVLQNRTVPEEETVTKVPAKKVPSKTSSEFIREKSSSATPDSTESVDKNCEKKEDSDELGSLSSKLLDKLAEEESKLKKINNLEIGTWSNEMAEEVENMFDDADEEEEEFDEDELDWLGPNIALPDNLTFIDKTILPKTDKGGRDWGTGIAQKTFRVGSPTFFKNPNINIPGMMDDLDGFSCSDSGDEDIVPVEEIRSEEEEVVAGGLVRIEFRAGNTAEAIEDEAENTKRVETLAREKAEEEAMLENIPWEWREVENMTLAEAFDRDVVEAKEKLLSKDCFILGPDVGFSRTVVPTSNSSDSSSVDEKIELLPPQDEANNLKVVTEMEPFSHVGEMLQKSHSCPKDFSGKESGIIPRASDPVLGFSFDEQPDLVNHPGPSPSLMLQALTMSNSNDAINLERLETIGDSFLKYSITSFLFCDNGSVHEGRLSHLRSKQVSNLNLYRLGRGKNLGLCMVATKFEPHDNWLPPCYHVPHELEQALIMSGIPASHWNMADLPDIKELNRDQITSLIREKIGPGKGGGSSVENMPSFVPYNLLTQHSIPDKSIADCVESLIGAYLIACGPQGALLFMTWLGLTVLPSSESGNLVEAKLPIPPSPMLDPSTHLEVNHLLDGYDTFEELIGYRFHDRSYLLQAFSHASYYPNRFTDCYQRLEFLGDAVLDYLITRQLFEDPRLHSPGALTDLRSALVNNTIFASLAVKFQFHKFFKFFSPGLQTVINRFVKIQAENGYAVAEDFYLLDEDDSEEAEDIEVPKSLGDIFESVAGAIFLDSKLSLDAVWRVYYRMMKPEIDKYSQNVPKSPIRELLELEPETAKFGKPEKLADGRRVRVSVEVFGKGVFKGIGRNYRIAKCTAAKCALRALKKGERSNAR